MGYYGGAGARKVATIEPSGPLPQVQPTCLSDGDTGVDTGLIDCGNWTVSASWTVPTDATSGIYFAKLVREDLAGGAPEESSHIHFIVRDDEGHSDLLFQTSDTTWHAYNLYGGNSLYCGGPISNAGTAYACATRSAKVSTTVRSIPPPTMPRALCGMRNTRWSAGWKQTATTSAISRAWTPIDSPARLLDHKVFLSVGHDEDWSHGQRANVEAARDAGLNLAFFSGNEVFWKTRWESSIDGTDTARRTLVTYKETLAGAKIDPSPLWTGTWRDPRFTPPADGGRPENGLTGTIWTVNCCTYAIQVPFEMSRHRFWRNTSIATMAPGAIATLSDNTLGYEWDEDVDNSARPTGLVRLSSTTVNVPEKLLDFGAHVGPGIARHSLTLYRAHGVNQQGSPTSALVFGAGTVQWSWGLDGIHVRGASTPDLRMQQATVNLFLDMNAQPGTLQPGLVATAGGMETVPPTSTITSPTGGSTIPLLGHTAIQGTAADVGGVVAGVEVSLDGGISWHPAQGARVGPTTGSRRPPGL